MSVKRKEVTGDLHIFSDGMMTIDDVPLFDDETITISVKQLRNIIQDAKKGLI